VLVVSLGLFGVYNFEGGKGYCFEVPLVIDIGLSTSRIELDLEYAS